MSFYALLFFHTLFSNLATNNNLLEWLTILKFSDSRKLPFDKHSRLAHFSLAFRRLHAGCSSQ